MIEHERQYLDALDAYEHELESEDEWFTRLQSMPTRAIKLDLDPDQIELITRALRVLAVELASTPESHQAYEAFELKRLIQEQSL